METLDRTSVSTRTASLKEKQEEIAVSLLRKANKT